MTDQPIYNSRDSRYKTPYGAVPSGAQVRFTLRPGRVGGFSRATLSARFESRGDQIESLPMLWSGLELDRDLFQGSLDTGDYVGLVWYSCWSGWMEAARNWAPINSPSIRRRRSPPGLERG